MLNIFFAIYGLFFNKERIEERKRILKLRLLGQSFENGNKSYWGEAALIVMGKEI